MEPVKNNKPLTEDEMNDAEREFLEELERLIGDDDEEDEGEDDE